MIGLRTYSACHEVAASNVDAVVWAILAIAFAMATVGLLIERRRQDRRFVEMRGLANEALGVAETAASKAEHAARMAPA